jgi:hypothetical protein
VSEDEDGPATTGIAVFDELPKAERLAVLACLAKVLTDEDAPRLDLTALTGVSIAWLAVFETTRNSGPIKGVSARRTAGPPTELSGHQTMSPAINEINH